MDDRIGELSYWQEKPISPISAQFAELGAAVKEAYDVANEALDLINEVLARDPMYFFDVEPKGEGNYLTLRVRPPS